MALVTILFFFFAANTAVPILLVKATNRNFVLPFLSRASKEMQEINEEIRVDQRKYEK